ncbi:MAG: hypothetical protein KC609_03060 [Myxococcales bacterium]|nr:hypothetical protein [Myxococcales bacterium]
MMRCARAVVLVMVVGGWLAGCALTPRPAPQIDDKTHEDVYYQGGVDASNSTADTGSADAVLSPANDVDGGANESDAESDADVDESDSDVEATEMPVDVESTDVSRRQARFGDGELG